MKDTALLELFLNDLWLEKGLSHNTVQSYRLDLMTLSYWLAKQELTFISLDAVDLQRFLAERLEKGYKASSTSRLLSAMRKLFQYLAREKYRSDDPSVILSSPKLPGRLPKYLSEQQVSDLLNTPSTEIPLELRDKAMGLSEFGSCLSGQDEGSMVILIDQSGSLRTTDPDKARVRAAQYLVERMASFS